jgi:hypothetical protein
MRCIRKQDLINCRQARSATHSHTLSKAQACEKQISPALQAQPAHNTQLPMRAEKGIHTNPARAHPDLVATAAGRCSCICTTWSQGKWRLGECSATVAVAEWEECTRVKERYYRSAESTCQPTISCSCFSSRAAGNPGQRSTPKTTEHGAPQKQDRHERGCTLSGVKPCSARPFKCSTVPTLL